MSTHPISESFYRVWSCSDGDHVPGEAGPGCSRSFIVTGTDNEQLLQAFLSELLCLTETENIVFSEISVIMGEGTLSVDLSGERFDLEKHGGGTEVKGISFSGLAITEQNGIFELDILFDV